MNTKKLKQLVLDLAIHGKLVPQDPNDEPACELLKRIKENVETHGRACKSKKTAISSEEIDEVPFDVPTGWCWCRLESICDSCLGKMLDKSKTEGTYQPYLRNVNVRWNGFDLSDMLEMPFKQDEDERFSIKDGDLVICEGGEPGRCAIWEGNPIKFQKALHRVRCYGKIVSQYIQKVLESFSSNDMLEVYFTGSTIKHLTGESLSSILIPLPPLAEQHRIVAAIEKWFAVIDQLESNEGDLKKSIEQTKKKVLDLAIHGKLVKQDESEEPASELLKRIKENVETHGRACKSKKIVSQDIDLDEVPFEVPKGWVWCYSGEIAYIASGSTPSKESFVEDGIPYLKMYNLRNQKIDFAFHPQYIKPEIHNGKLARSRTEVGDIIMNIVGPPLGKLAIIPENLPEANFNQAAVLIRPLLEKDTIANYIFYYLSEMSEINSITTKGTAGQENISLTQSQHLRIPLPPLAEQHRIVAKIEEVFGELEKMGEMLG